jgi:hypothetical protein
MEAVVRWSHAFAAESQPCWAASSVPVGAGFPDLILATYRPEIGKLVDAQDPYAKVLAYLRRVRAAKADTIALRIGRPLRRLREAIDSLLDAEAIMQKGEAFKLARGWRQILPKTVAIETKVSDWQKAVEQAYRNTIFAHYSYVAFPTRLALKVCDDPGVKRLPVGVMAVDEEGTVRILRDVARTEPASWYYYYNLAFTLRRTNEMRDELCSAHRRRPTVVP